MTLGTRAGNFPLDVRHAVGSLRRSPGFALAAIVALVVGIGGNTAIFSVVDPPPAFRRSRTRDRRAHGTWRHRDTDRVVALVGTVDRGTIERRGASFPDFIDWRAEATAGFCGWRRRPDARTTCFTSRLQSIKCESPGIAIVSDIRTPVPARNVRI
jgi:hypothetical protein